MNLFRRLWKDEEGQGLVEYALIIAIISIVIIFAGPSIANAIRTLFSNIGTKLQLITS